MKCRVAGDALQPRVTDLPFKTGDTAIVILKSLPVLQCEQCGDIELEHEVMVRVDALLARIDPQAELEIIRYAA
ncbi:MAG: YgiT-type zinc finger protein [Acidobacteria bacterium]|nr:YgiT-type zinc finger protein [Acidobacteriota bacterium]